MDRMFDTYGELLEEAQTWLAARHPRQSTDSDFVHRQAVRAKGLDALRGLLPAGSLSNVGIYGTGQSYEQLLVRMRSHPLPEARVYADMMLEELRKVIPSFLQRVDRRRPGRCSGPSTSWPPGPTRPGSWRSSFPISWPPSDDHAGRPVGRAHRGAARLRSRGRGQGRRRHRRPRHLAPEAEVLARVRRLGAEEKRSILRAYVGERSNRRHRPGRAFERTDYRFDVVTDYGAFRDLQRHRILTIEWQPLGAALGYDVPEVVAEAGLSERYVASLERSRELYEALAPTFPDQASYAVALAYRIRYTMQMNAREAMHLLELRSGPQGHPSYRWVAQEMHRQIGERAGHRLIAEAMSHVDYGAEDLERLESERRAEQRRDAVPAATKPAMP